jgi:hypothetical protein
LIPRFTPTGSRIGANGGEGHSDTAMTLKRRYAHVLEDMEDEGGRAMDELF